MKRLLHNLRSRPPQVRLGFATIFAVFATALIVVGWLMVPSGQIKKETAKTPTPFNALVNSIAGVIKGSSGKTTNNQKVEIINAGTENNSTPSSPTYNTTYDETHPYQQN